MASPPASTTERGAGDSAPWRVFIALRPSPEVLAPVEEVRRQLASVVPRAVVRWTPPEQIHLTLKFIGDMHAAAVPELEAALGRAAASVAPFELIASGLGAFPGTRRPQVIWIGIKGATETLDQLHHTIATETAPWGRPEARPFHPHLTLGRARASRPRESCQLSEAITSTPTADLGKWLVTHMDIMRSELLAEGARHSCLSSVPLETGRH